MITTYYMLMRIGETKEKDGPPCSDWSLYTYMVKLIISQLDHSITLILFISCLFLTKLDQNLLSEKSA